MTWGTRATAGVVVITGLTMTASPALATTAPQTTTSTATTTKAATSSSPVTRYTTGTTNVRAGASTSSAVVGSLAAGTKITGVVQSNGWITIATPAALTGRYVSGAVLTANAPVSSLPTPQPMPSSGPVTAWVASDDHSVTVRSGPGLAYRAVGSYARGAKVTGVVTGDWVKTTQGYVSKGVLEATTVNPYAINGRIPRSQLCAVPTIYNSTTRFDPGYTHATVRYLDCTALKGLVALETAYKKNTGHYAPIDLAYRDAAEQQYWRDLYLSGKGNYARPVGQSNHGWGLSVDFLEKTGSTEFTYAGSGYAWLKTNAAAYGFAPNPGHQDGESYHWNFVG